MSFLELAKERYSVRAFRQDMIEEEKLQAVIEAGRVAPSACNKQPQKVYVVKSEEYRRRLAQVCRFTFDAPVILVVGYDRERDWKNKLMPGYHSGETDAAIVTTHMMLAAHDCGLGCCWVGYFNAQQVAEALELPETVQVTAMLPMGYPAEDATPMDLHSIYRDYDDTVSVL
ncbi:MAG: nitroreductase family protein [Clostridia bacterium]|nr:nitroreductase family protein [Clostridia bacterium]